jgi:hypothetical protein
VVKCFLEFPEDFHLPGHPEYPNSNAIYTKIMGKSAALVAPGYIQKVGTQKYRATPKAIARAQEIRSEEAATPTRRVTHRRIGRPEETALARLYGTAAWESYRAGDPDSITFYQCCRFYEISPRTESLQAIKGRLELVAHLIEQAVAIGEAGESLHLPVKGRERAVSPEDLRQLGALHQHLLRQFADDLNAMKARARAM